MGRTASDFLAIYRERPPCAALKEHVRAFFQFQNPRTGSEPPAMRSDEQSSSSRDAKFTLPAPPDVPSGLASVCPALFADPGTSIVFDIARGSAVDALWSPPPDRPPGYALGPMTRGRVTSFGDRVDTVGVYLRPGFGAALLGVPPSALANRIVGLDELWGAEGTALGEALERTPEAETRFGLLERALIRRLHARGTKLDRTLLSLAGAVDRSDRPSTVDDLANLAGLSRQQLTRRFRSAIGVPPKLFCRLSRFRRLLGQAGGGRNGADWAATFGYADQSHMIAEFREFTGLTPAAYFASRAFHPFSSPFSAA